MSIVKLNTCIEFTTDGHTILMSAVHLRRSEMVEGIALLTNFADDTNWTRGSATIYTTLYTVTLETKTTKKISLFMCGRYIVV